VSCSVHDLANVEALGVPACLVTTTEFTGALAAQAEIVGSTPRHVLVDHPIQDRTDEELHELADRAVDAIVRQLLAR
jgi:hypothetical protein